MSPREPSTSELRHDWLSDRWVIIAPQRSDRPDDFTPLLEPHGLSTSSNDKCPFCRGHENETPHPVAVYPESVQPGHQPPWLVRVVPNKFPAVNGVQSLRFAGMQAVLAGEGQPFVMAESTAESASELEASVRSSPSSSIDLFHARRVAGAHEVIIESPLHLRSLTQLDRQTAALIFTAYRDRLRNWNKCEDIAYSVVFKNVGFDAGASLVHTHSQLIATNVLPTDVRRGLERMELFERTESCCLFCRMLSDELDENVRIVAQTSDFVAFCPFASRLPSLVTIVPRDHECSFEDTSDDSVQQLSWLAHRVLRSVERCYPQAAYNYVLHTMPRVANCGSAFHWRMEIFPRLTRVAGFEWGSDCFINPLPPELAAQRLRASVS